MRAKATSKKNSRARRVVRVPWRVVEVRTLPRYRLFVRFADGLAGELSVRSFLFKGDPGVFEPLRDPGRFAEAFVEEGVVTWPGGQDMAPDAMYDDIKATGESIPE